MNVIFLCVYEFIVFEPIEKEIVFRVYSLFLPSSLSSLRINRAKLCDIFATCDAFLSDSNGFSAMTFFNTVWASFRL
jgi:hypothetical protein